MYLALPELWTQENYATYIISYTQQSPVRSNPLQAKDPLIQFNSIHDLQCTKTAQRKVKLALTLCCIMAQF
jgi:hypothetical protein